MCMCGTPTINGEPGYSWDGKSHSIRPIDPPELEDGDELMVDEPGRCGGLDAHCHHYRVVRKATSYASVYLLVKHGGGTERIPLSGSQFWEMILEPLDSNARFWLLNSMYNTLDRQRIETKEKLTSKWTRAFLDKRIKKRKQKGVYRVWIEDEPAKVN